MLRGCPAPIPPNPGPGPGPGPGPTPVTGQLWAIAVYDFDNLTTLPQGQLDARTSTTIKDALAKLNCKWWNADKNNPAVSKWTDAINAAGVPCLVIVDANNKIVGPGGKAVPFVDEADIVSKVGSLRK